MKRRGDDKSRFLFKAISESIDLYGLDGLHFILLNHRPVPIPENDEPPSNEDVQDLFTEINKTIERDGMDHIIYLIQNKRNLIPDLCRDLRHTAKMNDKVFEVACRVFNTDRQSIESKNERNGKRIYASGTVIKIFIEILDYSVEDIQKLIYKSKPVISKHKMLISNLDYRHKEESDAFKKYLFCKHQIIKFILNQENGQSTKTSDRT